MEYNGFHIEYVTGFILDSLGLRKKRFRCDLSVTFQFCRSKLAWGFRPRTVDGASITAYLVCQARPGHEVRFNQ